jgi:uncharacterized protein
MSTQYCTQCGKPVKPHARFCSQCGAQITIQKSIESQQYETINQSPKKKTKPETGDQKPVTQGGMTPQFKQINEKSGKTKNPKPETQNSSATTKKVIIGLFAAVIGILLLLVFQFITYEEHSVIAQQPVISEPVFYTSEPLGMTEVDAAHRDGYFVISLDDVKNNKFVRAWYDAATTQLPVVAYISPKGRLVTAVGITEPCGESDYTIVDNHIHCSNCTGEWDMNSMQPFGSCPKYFPNPIPSTVSGSEVLIATTDLDSWRRRW